jgi:KUP system potassium uptake protein
MISGAFSLTQQSVQLGYTPRVNIVHTSETEHGQIYIPEINKALAVGCLLIVLGFRNSGALGAAYGIAVTGTMLITSLLFFVVARRRWGWPLWKAGSIVAVFLAIDIAYFAANIVKVEQGGWVPLVIAIGIFTLMTTWKRGRGLLHEKLRAATLPLDMFLNDAQLAKTVRVPGTAVFMTSDPDGVPVVLLHHLKHNKVLHQQVVLLSVMSAEVPELASSGQRTTVTKLSQGFFRVTARYGFMETPNVIEIMKLSSAQGLKARPADTTYYLGREQLLTVGPAKMVRWRKKLFAFMARNARSATEFFGIPPNRVVELGTQVEF